MSFNLLTYIISGLDRRGERGLCLWLPGRVHILYIYERRPNTVWLQRERSGLELLEFRESS